MVPYSSVILSKKNKLTLEDGTDRWPETSVSNHVTPRNEPRRRKNSTATFNYCGNWQRFHKPLQLCLFPQVVTTTQRSLRRPTGALYNPNRVRQRSTTTTTTSTTTQTPAVSTESHQQRRQPGARLVRRRKYGSSSNRTRDSDVTASDVQPSDSSIVASTDKG